MYLCYREHGNGETAFNEINKGQMDCFSQIQRYDFLIPFLEEESKVGEQNEHNVTSG